MRAVGLEVVRAERRDQQPGAEPGRKPGAVEQHDDLVVRAVEGQARQERLVGQGATAEARDGCGLAAGVRLAGAALGALVEQDGARIGRLEGHEQMRQQDVVPGAEDRLPRQRACILRDAGRDRAAQVPRAALPRQQHTVVQSKINKQSKKIGGYQP